MQMWGNLSDELPLRFTHWEMLAWGEVGWVGKEALGWGGGYSPLWAGAAVVVAVVTCMGPGGQGDLEKTPRIVGRWVPPTQVPIFLPPPT